ncbi:MAG TPA: AIPR family protein [Steroidobacteraceae bacterium]
MSQLNGGANHSTRERTLEPVARASVATASKKSSHELPCERAGVQYLGEEFAISPDRALQQVAPCENDYGLDGFHYDRDRRNLYLFQFKRSESYGEFKQSINRLIESGMERIFSTRTETHRDQLLLQLKSCLTENEAAIDRICIHFVFSGDPAEAERSQVLDKLREDLENKKHLIDHRFGRPVTLVIEFRCARTRKVGAITHVRKTHTYPVKLGETVTRTGPNGEVMTIGFVRLPDLLAMYGEMGQRFFERNIRAALREDVAVNKAIQRSARRIVLEGKESAATFGFNHNGVTLFAEKVTSQDGIFNLTEPRLLNGAQTVTTFARFLSANAAEQRLAERRGELDKICVMCRIITSATPEFVTSVTINNNRQNPVDPWNLRANDLIQLEIQDKFRTELGLYYERQERAFKNLTDDVISEQGISSNKPVELAQLARTFLMSDGELDRIAHFREVFEDERVYSLVFNQGRLKADARHILLCYKAQSRLRRLITDIVEAGANKYAYVHRARNLLWALLCQAILNDSKLEEHAQSFGRTLSLEAQYSEWLSELAMSRCRFILADLVADRMYAAKTAEGNFSFMRTNAAYHRSLEIAHKRWRWTKKQLGK